MKLRGSTTGTHLLLSSVATLMFVGSLSTAGFAATTTANTKSIAPPAPRGATWPTLAVEQPTTTNRAPELLMTWLAAGERGGKLMFSRRTADGWSPPVTIAEPVQILGATEIPSLTVIETQGVRRTLLARTGDVVARSGDGGRTWARLPTTGSLSKACFAGGDGGAFGFWLEPQDASSAKLLGTRVLAGQTELDPRVSNAAGISAAMTWDGPLVVYRDLGSDGAQDIALVRRQKGEWTPPQVIATEGTRGPSIASAPHVAALERRVAVGWYSESLGNPRLRVAFSTDAGATFAPAIDVASQDAERGPTGAVAVALERSGSALVLWQGNRANHQATLELVRIEADGRRGSEIVLVEVPAQNLLGTPQLALVGEEVVATWVEGPLAQVQVVSLPQAEVPPALAVAAAPRAATPPTGQTEGQGRVGDLAPADRPFPRLDGESTTLASLRGRAVVLNFWATWCAPCVAEMPELKSLEERYRARGLSVVGLNVDLASATDKVRAFALEHQLPFAVWLDPEMKMAEALRVRGLPTTFVIDREGRIVLRRDQAIVGVSAELENAIAKALGEP